MERMNDQEFLESVVRNLVDHPEDVAIDRTVDEMGVLLTLKVNPQDLGQVIGRDGQTAKALRTLLRVIGAKHHARVNMKIYEPEGYRKGPMRERQETPKEDAGAEPAAPSSTDENAGMDDLKL